MSDNDDRKQQQETFRRQPRRKSSGPLVPLLIFVTIVFAINDNRSNGADDRVRRGKSVFSDTAVLSGVTRKYDSSTFKHGEAEAFLGGIDLDFRDAIMEGDEARLDVTAIMGGVKIRVPRTWTVDNRAVVALGGVEDQTQSNGGNKRLIIEGTVLLGGLELNN
jgi:hypothetical protein